MAIKIVPKINITSAKPSRGKQDIQSWLSAWVSAESANPSRKRLIDLYEMLLLDLQLESAVSNRKNKVLGEKFLILDKEGNENVVFTKFFDKKWFKDFCRMAVDATFYGYSLIEINEIDANNEISKVELVERRNILVARKEVAFKDGDKIGIPFSAGNYANYYIFVEKEGLGLLNKTASIVLTKRFAMLAWSIFLDKFGLPILALHSDDNETSKMLDALNKLALDGTILLPKNSELKPIFPAAGDSSANFYKMLEYCDAQISKGVHGQTMVGDNGGSLAQGNVHENTAEEIQESDMEGLQDVVNSELIPKMVALGYPKELLDCSAKFQRLKQIEDSVRQQKDREDAEITTLAFNRTLELIKTGFYEVPVSDIFEKFGITVTPKAQATATTKNLDNNLVKNIVKKKLKNHKLPTTLLPSLNAVDNGLFDDIFAEITKQLQKIADFLFSGGDISDFMMEKIAVLTSQLLIKAANLGAEYAIDPNLVAALEANIFRFSSAKSYQQLLQMQKLLIDDQGNRRSLQDYKRELDKLNITYNRNYIATEYNLAITTAQVISRWGDLTNGNPDALITYDAVGDGLTTDICNRLDKTCLPASDSFWSINTPPNHFNCRSTIRKGTAINLPKNLPKIDTNFAFNPATQGAIFASNYNYFSGFPDFVNKAVLDKKGNLDSFDRETFDEKKNVSFKKFDTENLFGDFSKSVGGGASFYGKSVSISDNGNTLSVVASISDNENIIQIQSQVQLQVQDLKDSKAGNISQFDFSKSAGTLKEIALIKALYKQFKNVNIDEMTAKGSVLMAKLGFYCVDKKQVMTILESAEKAKNKKAKALRKLIEEFYKENENKPFPMKKIFDLDEKILILAQWEAFLDLTDAQAKKDFEKNIDY